MVELGHQKRNVLALIKRTTGILTIQRRSTHMGNETFSEKFRNWPMRKKLLASHGTIIVFTVIVSIILITQNKFLL